MIPDDSFLRCVPQCLAIPQRLPIQTVAFCIDTIYAAHARLQQAAAVIHDNSQESGSITMSRTERVLLFADVWTIVDNIHTIRSLFQKEGVKEGGVRDQFLKATEDFSLARNMRDHIAGNVKNIASAKDGRPPPHGILNFSVFLKGAEPANPTIGMDGAFIYTIMSDFTHHNHEFIALVAGLEEQVHIPVGSFKLEVLGRTLNLSKVVIDLPKLIEVYDTIVRQDVENAIREFCEKDGTHDPDKLIRESAGPLDLVAKVSFVDPDEAAALLAQENAELIGGA